MQAIIKEWGNLNPIVLTGDTQVTQLITHRSSYDIEVIPFTSYPKKVRRRTYSTEGV
jgi:hypothetical protein